MKMKPKTYNAIALKKARDKRHSDGLYEVRGIWAGKELHESIRDKAARLVKAAGRERATPTTELSP